MADINTIVAGMSPAQLAGLQRKIEKQAGEVTSVEAQKAKDYPDQRIQLGRAYRDSHGTVLICLCQKCGEEHAVYSSDVHQKFFCAACKPEMDKAKKNAAKAAAAAFKGMSPEQIQAAIKSATSGK